MNPPILSRAFRIKCGDEREEGRELLLPKISVFDGIATISSWNNLSPTVPNKSIFEIKSREVKSRILSIPWMINS